MNNIITVCSIISLHLNIYIIYLCYFAILLLELYKYLDVIIKKYFNNILL